MMRVRVLAAALLAGAAVGLAGAPALADGGGDAVATPPVGFTWGATIDRQDVESSTANDPVELPAGRDVEVALSVENRSTRRVEVRNVRLEGRVLGMSFYSFTSQINLVAEPNATETRTIRLDLGELGDQAVGLIPARMSLLAPDRSTIDEQEVATDVRGSLFSAYGLFGLAVGLVTLVLVVGLAVEIAGHRLPVNRWRRAVRFLAPGLGIGLVATFTVSATRLLLPGATVWVPLVLVCGGVAFVIGYLTPTPQELPPRSREVDDGYPSQALAAIDEYAPPMLPTRHPAPNLPAGQPPRQLP
jgi:hypothetical protein